MDIHNTDHPIVRNFDQLSLYDESYWKLTGQPADVTLLATSIEDGMPTPQMWTTEKGKGRVFVSIPGHYSWTFDDPLFRILLLRGIAWTAHEPVDRFNDLVTPGAQDDEVERLYAREFRCIQTVQSIICKSGVRKKPAQFDESCASFTYFVNRGELRQAGDVKPLMLLDYEQSGH